VSLLNVSYDPTRELYQDFNAAFSRYWQAKTGDTVTVKASHGGSGKQARAIIDGLEADVATLALAADIDALASKGNLVSNNWQSRLQHNSSPYTSTIVFLVRKGNPKGIKDWNDLVKPGVAVITPNPKTSGGARWNYLAAWGYALKHNANDQAKAKEFVGKLFANVPVLDSGARGSTPLSSSAASRRVAGLGERSLPGDQGAGAGQVRDRSAQLEHPGRAAGDCGGQIRRQTRHAQVAEAYLNYLYTPEGQEIAAKNYYRPTDAKVAAKYAKQFPKLNLNTIDEVFGGWTRAQKEHFADGGSFDQIYTKK